MASCVVVDITPSSLQQQPRDPRPPPPPPWLNQGPCSHLPYILAVTLSVNLLPLLYYRPSDGRLDWTALACTQREHERFVLIATSSRSLSLCISRTCDIDIIAVLCVLTFSYSVTFNGGIGASATAPLARRRATRTSAWGSTGTVHAATLTRRGGRCATGPAADGPERGMSSRPRQLRRGLLDKSLCRFCMRYSTL